MADAAAATAEKPKKAKQGRSPAYPGIDLKVALEKAKALYDAEGKYAAPMASAFVAWGFGAKSSGGREIRAALRYFGIITLEGEGETGKVKLTDKALRVLLDEREDQTEKKAIIRELALTPAVHKALLQEFPDGIKSDATVEHFLVFEQGFNKGAAGEIVAEYKATAAFAGLYGPDIVVDKSDPPVREAGDGGRKDDPLPDPPAGPKAKVVVMAGERIVFTEESGPQNYLKLIASGEVDETMLEALEDYVKRQKKRIEREAKGEAAN